MHALRMQGLCAAAIGRAVGGDIAARLRANFSATVSDLMVTIGHNWPSGMHGPDGSQFAAQYAIHAPPLGRDRRVALHRLESLKQIVGWYARFRVLAISHETIYRHIWRDKKKRRLAACTFASCETNHCASGMRTTTVADDSPANVRLRREPIGGAQSITPRPLGRRHRLGRQSRRRVPSHNSLIGKSRYTLIGKLARPDRASK